MIEKEAADHAGRGDFENLPWDEPCMVITRGRFYLGTFFIRMPPCLQFGLFGGDLAGLVWRYDKTPDEWVLTYRFRYYNTPNNPDDTKDRKRFYAGKIRGAADGIREKTRQFCAAASGAAGQIAGDKAGAFFQWVDFAGDCDKVFDILTKNPPDWMRVRVEKIDGA